MKYIKDGHGKWMLAEIPYSSRGLEKAAKMVAESLSHRRILFTNSELKELFENEK